MQPWHGNWRGERPASGGSSHVATSQPRPMWSRTHLAGSQAQRLSSSQRSCGWSPDARPRLCMHCGRSRPFPSPEGSRTATQGLMPGFVKHIPPTHPTLSRRSAAEHAFDSKYVQGIREVVTWNADVFMRMRVTRNAAERVLVAHPVSQFCGSVQNCATYMLECECSNGTRNDYLQPFVLHRFRPLFHRSPCV